MSIDKYQIKPGCAKIVPFPVRNDSNGDWSHKLWMPRVASGTRRTFWNESLTGYLKLTKIENPNHYY